MICPILCVSTLPSIPTKCVKEECGWFVNSYGKCALVAIAVSELKLSEVKSMREAKQ